MPTGACSLLRVRSCCQHLVIACFGNERMSDTSSARRRVSAPVSAHPSRPTAAFLANAVRMVVTAWCSEAVRCSVALWGGASLVRNSIPLARGRFKAYSFAQRRQHNYSVMQWANGGRKGRGTTITTAAAAAVAAVPTTMTTATATITTTTIIINIQTRRTRMVPKLGRFVVLHSRPEV